MLSSGVPADGIDYLPAGAEYAQAGQHRPARRGGQQQPGATRDAQGRPARRERRELQRDVAVLAALGRGMRDRVQDGLPRLVRLDDLVDDPQGQRTGQPAGNLLVLGR